MALTTLTRDTIAADFEQVRVMLNDELQILRGPKEDALIAEACRDMTRMMAERPDFFLRFDYVWAASPHYASGMEAWFQREVIEVLSLMPQDHPDLARHRPVVVRAVSVVDYATTTVKGPLCDYILISEPYLALVRGFVVLLRHTFETLDPDVSIRSLDASWIGDGVAKIVTDGRSSLHEFLRPFQTHAVCLARAEQPRESPPQLNDWMRDGVARSDHLALDLAHRYLAVDRFVVFHELAHLLHGDLHDAPRSIRAELIADRSALSLTLARLEALPDDGGDSFRALAAEVLRDVVLGGATFLQMLRLVTLFGEAHRWVAVMSDQSYGTNQEPLKDARRSLDELEQRLLNLVVVSREFMGSNAEEQLLGQVRSLDELVRAAKILLLDDAGTDMFDHDTAGATLMPGLAINFAHVGERLVETLAAPPSI